MLCNMLDQNRAMLSKMKFPIFFLEKTILNASYLVYDLPLVYKTLIVVISSFYLNL